VASTNSRGLDSGNLIANIQESADNFKIISTPIFILDRGNFSLKALRRTSRARGDFRGVLSRSADVSI
jgi:hypothetical protein